MRLPGLALALIGAVSVARGAVLTNSASGTSNGTPLDPARASVSLTLATTAVSSALAEIAPGLVTTGSAANAFIYDIMPTIGPSDAGVSRIEITVPPGYASLAVTGVDTGSTSLAAACPSPAAGQYCASILGNVITVSLGARVTTSLMDIRVHFTADAPGAAGFADFTSIVGDGPLTAPTSEGNADGDAGDANSIRVQVVPTQGKVLDLRKSANKQVAVVGEVVTYAVEIRNTVTRDVTGVVVEDTTPPGFRYVSGSARLDGAPIPEPTGQRTLMFLAGTVPALVDGNGNGVADPGEPGYRVLLYQLVIGSGASPGGYVNTAVARDFCPSCLISGTASARVEVSLDPVFDLGTIIGKVFDDRNGNGWQDRDEPGVPDAFVALDDGTYALTDESGRYHFPAVRPGHRMVKLDLGRLHPGSSATAGESKVVWATPGLMITADFGVALKHAAEAAASPGVAVRADPPDMPVMIKGDVETPSLAINGSDVPLVAGDVLLQVAPLSGTVHVRGTRFEPPIRFDLDTRGAAGLRTWALSIDGPGGAVLKTFHGEGSPPGSVDWEGSRNDGRPVVAGDIYGYRLTLVRADGSTVTSPRRLFGVDRTGVDLLQLRGDAFLSGKSALSEKARSVLDQAAAAIRQHPPMTIVIEGHTDSMGSNTFNMGLSKARAESALRYLVERQGLPKEQFVLAWYGEDRPIATNDTAEGRSQNRRVMVQGEAEEGGGLTPLDPERVAPEVRIGGRSVEVGEGGRFEQPYGGPAGQPIDIAIAGSTGRSIRTAVTLPSLVITSPSGERLLPPGGSDGICSAGHPPAGGVWPAGEPAVHCRLEGRTEAGNLVELDGHALAVDGSGTFTADLPLGIGSNRARIVARKADGPARIADLTIEVASHDAEGRLTVASGSKEEEAGPEPKRNQLFLMAFAEGTYGKLKGKGYLKGAGLDDANGYYTDGRAAWYLKGVIAGKYLITSAFDSAKNGRDTLFGDLDRDGERRLLTNLDPDKFYPVYGDASTVVFDAESRGKFYLALDSDEIHAVVGDYPLSLSDTGLASYRRTLYGGRFIYQSAARTQFGDPDTQIVVFGAEVKNAHVHDELRATGGALYYLSRGDVVEGSEEVTLVVREKNTGLLISRERQQRNVDYVFKHQEGRLMFQRPIQSVVPGGSIVDQAILSGNPVFIFVDYESVVSGFEKTASGGRVRRQIGDRLAVGGTYVKDQLDSGTYELKGADAEVRLGENSRLTAEVAGTTGTGSLVNLSEDGGLSYTAVPASGAADGSAWKLGFDLDAGAWFGQPGRHRVRGYLQDISPGFSSNGSLLEQGTRKGGIESTLGLTAIDILRLRYDRETRDAGAPLAAGPDETAITSVQWNRARERWGVAAEYFDTNVKGTPLSLARADRTSVAARFWTRLSEKLTARFERQQTLRGTDNDQTTAGLQYQALPSLALEFLAAVGTLGTSAQTGIAYTRGASRVYLTERLSQDTAGEKTTTVLGARSPIGRTSQVYSEYQWEDSSAGGRTVSLLGLQRQWDVGTGMRFLLSGEVADATGSSGDSSRSALSGGFTYGNEKGSRISSRQEMRWERATDRRRQFLTINQADLPLNSDITLLARFRYSRTDNRDLGAVDARLDERVLGAAFRPVAHDRFNALFKYTSLLDQRPVITASDLRTERRMDVFSLDTSFRISRRLEWLAKEAARIMDEKVGDLPAARTNTFLYIQRFNVNLWKPVGVALEYRALSQREAEDLRRGWLAEVMWEFVKNFRAGAGYNFTDFSDDIVSQNDYSVRGWFFRVEARY